MLYTLISYCNNTWPTVGGVARYDTQLSLIFPNRIFFKAPEDREKMLIFLKACKNPIVITDNHLSCDIPNNYPVLLVHHGCALTTYERNPLIGQLDSEWENFFCKKQKEMLVYRKPNNTWIISISKACSDDFNKYFPNTYPKFKRIDILHPSELDESKYKTGFNKKPIILGNWSTIKKGIHLIHKLIELCPQFEFKSLDVMPNENESLYDFNKRKQYQYLSSDMFLQVANSEGFSYASNDAMICGLVPICTDVGGFYKDVDKNAFVKINWEKCYKDIDINYIISKLEYGWNNRDSLSKNAREWYLNNCRFEDWSKKMKDVINDFYIDQYGGKLIDNVKKKIKKKRKKRNKIRNKSLKLLNFET